MPSRLIFRSSRRCGSTACCFCYFFSSLSARQEAEIVQRMEELCELIIVLKKNCSPQTIECLLMSDHVLFLSNPTRLTPMQVYLLRGHPVRCEEDPLRPVRHPSVRVGQMVSRTTCFMRIFALHRIIMFYRQVRQSSGAAGILLRTTGAKSHGHQP